MMELPKDLAQIVVSPESYADWDNLHEALSTIRRDYPFARAEISGYQPFWVASKFEDIRAIARDNEGFLSGLGGILDNESLAFEKEAGVNKLFRSIVAMNEPDHRRYRALTQHWFLPASVRKLDTQVESIAKTWVDRFLDEYDGQCDFVSAIGVHFPLLVVMSILGVPEEDEPMMLRLTQEYFGSADSDMNRTRTKQDARQRANDVREVLLEATEYFAKITADRRANPRDDLATVIANAEIDGQPISKTDAMGYFITVAFAGHDTTSSSLAGGLWALAENPKQLELVKQNPELIDNLVEESIRWTTPIHQFTRIAARDCEFQGQQIRQGDFVILSFPSGNRDETVFDDPYSFRLDRKNNTHVGFGYGAHMCLGMHLARLELKKFFTRLLPRIEHIELTGSPTRTVTNFVGGPKSLPIKVS